MSLFVTGTGTEIGKTITCAVILSRYGRHHRLAYWKPIASGTDTETDTAFVKRTNSANAEVLPETYLFDAPLSPHLASRLQRRRILPERIVEDFVAHALADAQRNLLIEGVGGLLVPLTANGYLLANLIADLALPCLIVASSRLGTINHTLLTLEAARARRLDVAGVVLSGPPNRENRRAIERFGKTAVLAELPLIQSRTRQGIARAGASFDRRGRLGKYFE